MPEHFHQNCIFFLLLIRGFFFMEELNLNAPYLVNFLTNDYFRNLPIIIERYFLIGFFPCLNIFTKIMIHDRQSQDDVNSKNFR